MAEFWQFSKDGAGSIKTSILYNFRVLLPNLAKAFDNSYHLSQKWLIYPKRTEIVKIRHLVNGLLYRLVLPLALTRIGKYIYVVYIMYDSILSEMSQIGVSSKMNESSRMADLKNGLSNKQGSPLELTVNSHISICNSYNIGF